MIRVFLFVIALGAVLLAAGIVYLGMFPPNPVPRTVQTTIPVNKIQSH
jgi:hypothetical protein